jgi:TonB family protein
MAMFEAVPKSGSRRWRSSMLLSVAIHLLVLGALLYRVAPAFITPSDVDFGIPHSSGSQSIVYLAPVGPEQSKASPTEPKLALRAKLTPKPKPPKPEPKPEEAAASTAADAPLQTARGGSLFGHVPGSPLTGDEVVPAFPDVYPDPPISRSDLPSGVQGDVIVEVTIDPQGNVVETKVLQGMGYGVEQKVLEVLQRWHFHPAMRDGQTIASQHIVHFHYPA